VATIKAPAEIQIEIPEEVLDKAKKPDEKDEKKDEKKEKAASPVTLEMVIARLDAYASKFDQIEAKINSLGESPIYLRITIDGKISR